LRVLHRHPACLGQLLDRRLAAVLDLELLAGAAQLVAPLVHVHGDADRLRLVRDCPLAGLADPPRGVRGELEALAPVELLAARLSPMTPS
jgi:hypothetical protein